MLIFYAFKKRCCRHWKTDGVCSLTFDVDEFSELIYVNQSFLLRTQDLHK